MLKLKNSWRLPFVALAALVASGMVVSHSDTAWAKKSKSSAGTFKNLKGWWKGGGRVKPKGSSSERLSCRATYKVSGGGKSMRQVIRCAGTDYKFRATSNLRIKKNGRVSGSWSESVYGKSGSAYGRVRGNKVYVSLRGGGSKGSMTITMRGRKHSVYIGGSAGSLSVSFRK